QDPGILPPRRQAAVAPGKGGGHHRALPLVRRPEGPDETIGALPPDQRALRNSPPKGTGPLKSWVLSPLERVSKPGRLGTPAIIFSARKDRTTRGQRSLWDRTMGVPPSPSLTSEEAKRVRETTPLVQAICLFVAGLTIFCIPLLLVVPVSLKVLI